LFWCYGSPNKSGKSSSHGSPLGLDEIKLVRNALNWNYKPFEIPNKILNEWKKIGKKGQKLENNWNKIYKKKKVIINNLLKNNFTKILKTEKEVIERFYVANKALFNTNKKILSNKKILGTYFKCID